MPSDRRARLASARLYAICDVDRLARVASCAIDVLQLRDKRADRPTLLRAIEWARQRTTAVLIVNDDPELALDAGADGVHLGQDDMPVAQARAILGTERLIGLSTHSEAQIDAARGVDYIGVGPVFATPTKPGHAPVGLELVSYAAAHAAVPFFAIGGIDARNVAAVRAAGAQGIAVVRAIADAADPAAAALALRAEVRVGAA